MPSFRHPFTALLLVVLLVFLGLLGSLTGCDGTDREPAASREEPADPLDAARTAFKERDWDQAIQLAELVLETQPDNQNASDIVARASTEKDNLARYNQARALFEAEQYDKAYIKLQKIPEQSVYSVRARNMSLRIRQAVVLPEIIRRPGNSIMRRVLIGPFARGSDDREIDLAMELCEKHVGECQRKWFTRESPRKWITLGSFYIDANEVSTSQYEDCVQAGDCTAIDWQECGLDESERIPFSDPVLPQVCVTWEQARHYCQQNGARLPTEAEWEKAAGGLRNDRFPWGSSWRSGKANFADIDGESDGFSTLAPVTEFDPNSYGVRNMAGNAYEWVHDWYQDEYYGEADDTNPTGPAEGKDRVIRGGAFTRAPSDLRVAHRNRMYPTTRDKSVGFRCATSATDIPSDVEPTPPLPEDKMPDGESPERADPDGQGANPAPEPR